MSTTARTPYWFWGDDSVISELAHNFHQPGGHDQKKHGRSKRSNVGLSNEDAAFLGYVGPASLMGGEDGSNLNTRIRERKTTEKDRKTIGALNTLIATQNPLEAARTFFRLLPPVFDKMGIGDVIADPAFVSTTSRPNFFTFASGLLFPGSESKLLIEVPEGARILDVMDYHSNNFKRLKETGGLDVDFTNSLWDLISEEEEFILPTQSRFRVNKKSVNPEGQTTFGLTYLSEMSEDRFQQE